MKHYITLMFFLLVGDAMAKDLVVNQQICDQMVIDHTPDADVAYKPSEDMGPPADIGGTKQIQLPKEIKIPISVDTQKYMGALGNPANSGLDYADLGSVVVHDDGRVYYNGQPLFDEDQQAIKEACKKLKG